MSTLFLLFAFLSISPPEVQLDINKNQFSSNSIYIKADKKKVILSGS